MYWLKGCPRCRGDLLEVDDLGIRYVSCLQCGKILTESQEQALPRTARVATRMVVTRPGKAAA